MSCLRGLWIEMFWFSCYVDVRAECWGRTVLLECSLPVRQAGTLIGASARCTHWALCRRSPAELSAALYAGNESVSVSWLSGLVCYPLLYSEQKGGKIWHLHRNTEQVSEYSGTNWAGLLVLDLCQPGLGNLCLSFSVRLQSKEVLRFFSQVHLTFSCS